MNRRPLTPSWWPPGRRKIFTWITIGFLLPAGWLAWYFFGWPLPLKTEETGSLN